MSLTETEQVVKTTNNNNSSSKAIKEGSSSNKPRARVAKVAKRATAKGKVKTRKTTTDRWASERSREGSMRRFAR